MSKSSDSVVVHAPDSTGKNIDTSTLTRADGTVVQRERVAIGDPDSADKLASISKSGRLRTQDEVLDAILACLERIETRMAILLS